MCEVPCNTQTQVAQLHQNTSLGHTQAAFAKCLYSLSISIWLPFGSMYSKLCLHTHSLVHTQIASVWII